MKTGTPPAAINRVRETDFWDGVSGNSAASLRAAIHDRIDDHQRYAYSSADTDGDGAFDRFEGIADNCPNDFNPGQRDIYGNGIGDVCDPEYIFYDHFEGTNLE